MDALIKKLVAWLPTNLAAVLGILQAILKFIKETLTLAIDIIAPIIPGDNDDVIIKKIRDIVNLVDEWVEKIKSFLLSVGS